MTKKKEYPDADVIFKGVTVMWARTLEDNPYPPNKGVDKDGYDFTTAERWSFDIVLSDAQAKVAKEKELYVKSKTDPETGATIHFINLSRSTMGQDGVRNKPFFIQDAETGEALQEEMANGTKMDVELYKAAKPARQTGKYKSRLKRGVVTDLIPYEAGSKGGASIDGPDSAEASPGETKPASAPKKKAPQVTEDMNDDIPF